MMKLRLVGYTRVSTEQQAEDGISLDAQRARLEAYAVAFDHELIAVETDAGLSAKTLERPGLQRALAMLGRGEADGLLVAKLDRLTRSVRDLGVLLEQHFSGKSSLLSVGDNIDTRSAAGRLVLNVLCSVAQWEREAIGERTREALAHLKAQGVRLGPPILGATPEEGPTVARILELYELGASLGGIAKVMQAEGWPTKRAHDGSKWCKGTISSVLRRAGKSTARR